MRVFTLMMTLGFSLSASAADFCVTGLKGTVTSAFTFKVSQLSPTERTVSVLENGKNQIFQSPAKNTFTQFNSTGYGVCSIVADGKDEATGAKYKIELKVSPHYEKACTTVGLPTSVEYITLKITPKGTTLGDDLTSYALSITPCP